MILQKGTVSKKPSLSERVKGRIYHTACGTVIGAGVVTIGAAAVGVVTIGAAVINIVGGTVAGAVGVVGGFVDAVAVGGTAAGAVAVGGVAYAIGYIQKTKPYVNKISGQAKKWCRRLGMAIGIGLPVAAGGWADHGAAKEVSTPSPAAPTCTIMGKNRERYLAPVFEGADGRVGGKTVIVLNDGYVLAKLPAAAHAPT